MEHAIRISAMETAQNQGDTKFLREQLKTATDTIRQGGTVRIQQQFSDASLETLHVLDTLEQVEKFMSKYLES